MQFRIVEKQGKKALKRVFYPQYKWFIFWINIANTHFLHSPFDKHDIETHAVYSLSRVRAENVVRQFNEYKKADAKYTKIHEVKFNEQ